MGLLIYLSVYLYISIINLWIICVNLSISFWFFYSFCLSIFFHYSFSSLLSRWRSVYQISDDWWQVEKLIYRKVDRLNGWREIERWKKKKISGNCTKYILRIIYIYFFIRHIWRPFHYIFPKDYLHLFLVILFPSLLSDCDCHEFSE